MTLFGMTLPRRSGASDLLPGESSADPADKALSTVGSERDSGVGSNVAGKEKSSSVDRKRYGVLSFITQNPTLVKKSPLWEPSREREPFQEKESDSVVVDSSPQSVVQKSGVGSEN